MKTSNNYIQDLMAELVGRFPYVRARYDHDSESDTHTIEVVPNNIYHSDDDFNEWQGDTVMNFINQFPFESICFVTDDSVLGLDKFQKEYVGMFYGKEIKQMIYNDYIPQCYHYQDLIAKSLNSLFQNSSPIFDQVSVSRLDKVRGALITSGIDFMIYPIHKSAHPHRLEHLTNVKVCKALIESPIIKDPDSNFVNAA